MSVPVKIALLVFGVCFFYTWVGNSVPQERLDPPRSVGADSTPDELAEAGLDLYKNQCTQCHGEAGSGGTQRAPDLDGIAVRAVDRAAERAKALGQPFSADDYIAESLLKPNAYVVSGFGPIMSFKLEPLQILAVIAYLQSLGGKPTAKAEGELWKKWGSEAASAGAPAVAAFVKQGTPQEMIDKYGCAACHDLEATTVKLGPGLGDIGSRMSPGDIFLQIIYPDSEPAAPPPGKPPYPTGTMKGTLDANGFYREVGPEDVHKLAVWLAGRKGVK